MDYIWIIYGYMFYMDYTYPLVNKQFANLKMAIEIVDLPIKKMVIFHSTPPGASLISGGMQIRHLELRLSSARLGCPNEVI